jgi:hypothetical protein
MKCPHCRHDYTRVIDTKDTGHKIRRYRLCRKCGFGFSTLEMPDLEKEDLSVRPADCDEAPAVEPPAVEEPVADDPECEPTTLQPAAEERRVRFRAGYGHIPAGTTVDAARLVLEWWNSSRWARHGKKAAWTEDAFMGSAERVAALSAPQQLELAQAGVEGGWMALKHEYLSNKPRRLAADEFAPTDPQLVEAMNGAL